MAAAVEGTFIGSVSTLMQVWAGRGFGAPAQPRAWRRRTCGAEWNIHSHCREQAETRAAPCTQTGVGERPERKGTFVLASAPWGRHLLRSDRALRGGPSGMERPFRSLRATGGVSHALAWVCVRGERNGTSVPLTSGDGWCLPRLDRGWSGMEPPFHSLRASGELLRPGRGLRGDGAEWNLRSAPSARPVVRPTPGPRPPRGTERNGTSVPLSWRVRGGSHAWTGASARDGAEWNVRSARLPRTETCAAALYAGLARETQSGREGALALSRPG
jgi:hypothetical protein